MSLNRRGFLKAVGAAVAVATTPALSLPAEVEAVPAIQAGEHADSLFDKYRRLMLEKEQNMWCAVWDGLERELWHKPTLSRSSGIAQIPPPQSGQARRL